LTSEIRVDRKVGFEGHEKIAIVIPIDTISIEKNYELFLRVIQLFTFAHIISTADPSRYFRPQVCPA
jgi:hypothetical protein